MQIIDGKKVSAQVKEEVKRQTLELKETHKITPVLAVVIVGDDPASRVYVNNNDLRESYQQKRARDA